MLDAHCVGFSTYGDRGRPGMWSEATWERCLDSVARLAEQAERAGMDVAAHPHAMAPLCSVERYREMLDRTGSPRLKVLIDIVNLTWPQRVFDTTALVNEVFDELGGDIVALHAKDVIISGGSGVSAAKGMGVIHVDEAVPGAGFMDFDAIVRRLDVLDHDVTVHVEHFEYEDTLQGQDHIRRIAERRGSRRPMSRLRDKAALVTGAGSGIGRATAVLFASEGAGVACADLSHERAKETAAEIERLRRQGGRSLRRRVGRGGCGRVWSMVQSRPWVGWTSWSTARASLPATRSRREPTPTTCGTG